jgi:hypothetical protein
LPCKNSKTFNHFGKRFYAEMLKLKKHQLTHPFENANIYLRSAARGVLSSGRNWAGAIQHIRVPFRKEWKNEKQKLHLRHCDIGGVIVGNTGFGDHLRGAGW